MYVHGLPDESDRKIRLPACLPGIIIPGDSGITVALDAIGYNANIQQIRRDLEAIGYYDNIEYKYSTNRKGFDVCYTLYYSFREHQIRTSQVLHTLIANA